MKIPVLKIRDGNGNLIPVNALRGDNGADGKSAYEQAKEGGYDGTEKEFIDLLNGLTAGEHAEHYANLDNPHKVTKEQIGLENVDNISVRPHLADFNNPHKVTAQQVGALPITGGQLEGGLTFVGEGNENTSEIAQAVDYATTIRNISGGIATILALTNEGKVSKEDVLKLWFADGNGYSIYGEHNKPNIQDLSGCLPVAKGGTGATSKEEAVKNIVGPWNLDENVGRISSSNNSTYKAKIYFTPDYGELRIVRYNIPMIHSGDIELAFGVSLDDTNNLNTDTFSFNILRNGESVFFEKWAAFSTKGHSIPLSVNKGDVITIALTGEKLRDSSTVPVIELTDIHLRANIDTPYKYINLRLEGGGDYFISEDVVVDPTAEELLNALMGGMSYE